MSEYPPTHRTERGCLRSKKVYQCSACKHYAAELIVERAFQRNQPDSFGNVTDTLRKEATYKCHNCNNTLYYLVSWNNKYKAWIGGVSASPAKKSDFPVSKEYSAADSPRAKPVSEYSPVGLKYAQNQHILKWWNTGHDKLIEEQIATKQWVWDTNIYEQIVQITDPAIIDAWRGEDRLCRKYAWYNILLYFAKSRAEQLGFTKRIRKAQWKKCLLCGERFLETSLAYYYVERLGIASLDFCAPCLQDIVFQGTGDNSASEENICEYLRDLAGVLGRVPTQNFGEGKTDFLDMDTPLRVNVLRLLQTKPTIQRVKAVYGSWLNALIQAHVLEDGARRTSRGIQTIARDGHLCLSLGEKTIDDFLYAHGIIHEKEPRYPEGNYRADFRVGDVFVEYFGLVGDPDYDAKIIEKTRICKKHKIALVALYPKDLVSQQKLERVLAPLMLSGGRQ